MPFAETNGGKMHFRIDGPSDAPLLVLSNSLGTDLTLWDRQLPALSRRFQVLVLMTPAATANPSSRPDRIQSNCSPGICSPCSMGCSSPRPFLRPVTRRNDRHLAGRP